MSSTIFLLQTGSLLMHAASTSLRRTCAQHTCYWGFYTMAQYVGKYFSSAAVLPMVEHGSRTRAAHGLCIACAMMLAPILELGSIPCGAAA